MTFIIDARGGGPSSGYVSSGFFGGKKGDYNERSLIQVNNLLIIDPSSTGLSLGRIALLWVNKKVSYNHLCSCSKKFKL